MASSNLSRTVVKSLKGRTFAAAAAQAEKVNTDSGNKCSIKKLNNGMVVGAAPSNSPISRIAVVANAGSRFENGDNLGVTHFLRMSSRLRTKNMTSLAMTRTAQQLGSDLTIMGTREYIYFKSNVTKNSVDKMVQLLQELTTNQVYQSWELSDIQKDSNGMLLDLGVYQTQPHIRAVELLHSAAFRNGLGNSLYAPDYMIGSYTPEKVMNFIKSHFTAGRMALIGLGVDEAQLEELASQFEPFASADIPVEKASYFGGELRENIGGEIAYVALGFQGPSLMDKDLLAAEVVRHIMGTGPHIKYSSGTTVPGLSKAVAQATDVPFHVSALNATYTDNGLFGFSAVAHKSQIEKVIQAAAKQYNGLASSNISDEDIVRGKNQLKSDICMQFENPDVLLHWLGEQALSQDGEIVTPEDISKMVDSISASDVKRVAKSLAGSRPSMAVVGNTANVPYLDSLFS